MRTTQKITQQQIDAILDLRESGYKMPRIAEKLGVSKMQVQYYCHKNNVPKGGQNWQQIARRAPFSRKGKPVRPFTAADDQLIENLRVSGMKVAVIARQIGRAKTSVRTRLITLANQAEGVC